MAEMSKILIANRGEIAVRVIRTAQAMGYRTVAVYSAADADAPHVDLADEAVPIGAAPVGDSYLRADGLIEACRLSGADAVHPGYGFLSENADFARACAAAGVTFIGPPPAAIDLMGSKRLSKRAMIAAGVPCIPGYQDSDQSDARLLAESARIGFPLMVKASAGGGGRGMRLVHRAEDLAAGLAAARSEALSAFGSDELILERALIDPRHIEIQVFADAHGNAIHLGERDCSVQRRHQKVIEEAPSPFVRPELRAAMGRAAVEAARACDYRGAGTVEFLVDADGDFYFLEMNTRLQVEHPVTEAITGQDLVAWQLKVAAGDPLPCTQDEIALDGWAIEARLYAEDPRNGFLPQTGRVLRWEVPQGAGLRVDHGIGTGQAVSPHYDPMLAKIVARGATRDEARRKLARAVEDTVLLGVNSNKAFLAGILRHPVFAAGGATTGFLSRHFAADATMTAAPPAPVVLARVAALFLSRARDGTAGAAMPGWRNTAAAPWPIVLRSQASTFKLTLTIAAHGDALACTAHAGDAVARIQIVEIGAARCVWIAGGLRRKTAYVFDGDRICLDGPFGNVSFTNVTHQPAARPDAAGSGRIAAPMDGAIVAVHVAPGARVAKGQTLAVLEAMKMEHRLVSDVDGMVEELAVAPGAQVKIRQLIARVVPDETGD